MEITVGEYGRTIFEMMTSKTTLPNHWKSIESEAKPLVEQLIALNEKVKIYEIINLEVKGKRKLTRRERIEKAQTELWSVKASSLKEGDLIWFDGENNMQIGQDNPVSVYEVTKKNIYVEVPVMGGEIYQPIDPNTFVLKAPEDWETYEEMYLSDQYWLDHADKMGI